MIENDVILLFHRHALNASRILVTSAPVSQGDQNDFCWTQKRLISL